MCGLALVFTDQWWKYPLYAVPMYTMQMAFINAVSPLMASVSMVFVPKKHRATFNAINSVLSVRWSGTSIIGGYILDHGIEFQLMFIITMSLQAVAALIWFPIVKLIPKEKCETG